MDAQLVMDSIRQYLPPEFWGKRRRGMVHQIDFNTLAASAVAQPGSFQQNNTGDFLCLAVSEIITTDAAGGTEQAFPEHLVQISTQSTAELWTVDGFHHAANFFGRSPVSGQPTVLPWPQLVTAGDTVNVLATNLEANARRIWMSFFGVLLY